MILSILIPSTTDRKVMTDKLYHYLQAQVLYSNLDEKVEIIVDIDNKEVSIGAKRQRMIESAKGEYVVQIDSDDWVSIDYIKTILKALEEKPDCVGHQIECSGTSGKTESVSIEYPEWAERKNGYDYLRTPYPKVPIKRSISLLIGYKDLRYGEDHDFSIRLKQSGFIEKETYIPQVLYFYRYKFAPHAQKYGIVRSTRNR
jgi:GT2 family glycosyltransferase